MKKNYIFNIFDSAFRIVIIFLLYFVWFRYFIPNTFISFLVTLICTFFTEVSISILKKYKILRNSKTSTYNNEIELNINSFIFSEDKNVVNFFYNLATTRHKCIKKSKYIIIENPSSTIILFPFFIYRDFIEDDLITVYNQTKSAAPTKVIICTTNISSKAQVLAKKLPIKFMLLNGRDTYEMLLKEYNCFPEKIELVTNNSITLKQVLDYSFNKKRTKGYFISSVLLLFSSFFVKYKIYYVVMSTILLIISFICYRNPSWVSKEKKETLFDN